MKVTDWTVTDKIIDIEIGEVRKNKYIKDDELMERFRKKYEIKQDYQIIFRDQCKGKRVQK